MPDRDKAVATSERGSSSGGSTAFTAGGGSGQPPGLERQGDSLALRWRHVQAFVRLSQVVHALADNISNWEVVVNCFVQLIYIISNQRCLSDDVTPHEIDKVFHAIHRFLEYSAFFSDEAVIQLTTALVCLSMHTVEASTVSLDSVRPTAAVAVTGERGSNRLGAPLLSSVSGAAKDVVQRIVHAPEAVGSAGRQTISTVGSDNSRPSSAAASLHYWSKAPHYLVDALSSGSISYALYAIIDVVKANTFRLSCVWHMVSSHLRTVALSKV